MGIIGLIIFGLIVGVIAKVLMPGRDPGGIIITMLLGIAGSFIGAFIGQLIWPQAGGWSWSASGAGWIMSILGAIILLALYRTVFVTRAAN